IVAPEGWQPRKAGYDSLGDIRISHPCRQVVKGSQANWTPEALPDLERHFWRNITLTPPLYGADVEASLFDAPVPGCGWNLQRLGTILNTVLDEAGHELPGINTPYLYFGQWRTMFPWHTEDMDLYSVNYLHFGAPKQWYVVPPHHRERFEQMAKSLVPQLASSCGEYLRHKDVMISPTQLDKYQIPYIKVVQRPGEFVVTFPGAYHAGFNYGFNCAESTNFATRAWVPIGARAGCCK
ncbi:Jumonji domain-containing protein, partial [Haematococcus lacustris]